MVDIAEQLVKKWERLNADDEIDVVHDMTALTLDTIGLCGFDYRFNSFYRQDYHPFVESLVRSLETIMMTRGLPLEGLWLRSRNRDLAADVAFMNKMVDEIVAERRKNAEAAEGKKDMLGAMMTGVDRATGTQLDDVNIRYQINTFLIAGHDLTPDGHGQCACVGRGFAMHEATLALGMILQRFKLIDVNRYQMVLKETLTIKPAGFKIKVRPRTDRDRGAYTGPATTAAAA